MTGIRPELCIEIKKARREAKLSQMDIAAEVDCKQSALSMFEQGDPTKLSEDVVERLAKKFSIDLSKYREKPQVEGSKVSAFVQPSTFNLQPLSSHTAFCPNPNCPTNHRFQVDGRELALPDRDVADPVGGRFCAMCGEVLIRTCPNCGAPVHKGAICSLCGEPYVAL